MEEYSEYYWVNGDEVPEDRMEDLFDWMFEAAQALAGETTEEEIRIIKSN